MDFSWLEHAFMKRALIATLMLAPMTAAVGTHVVNSRMAFFADAIAHSAFAGVALGVLFAISGESANWVLVCFGALVAVIITRIRRGSELSEDTVVGVAFSAVVATGIMIVSHAGSGGLRQLEQVLYGDILTVGTRQLVELAILVTIVTLFLLFGHNRLLLLEISPVLGAVRGIADRGYDYALSVLVAVVIMMSIPVIGLLLVTAMLVVPAAAARNLARSSAALFWWAVVINLIAAIGGLIGSYYLDTKTGATIICASAMIFAVSLAFKRQPKLA